MQLRVRCLAASRARAFPPQLLVPVLRLTSAACEHGRSGRQGYGTKSPANNVPPRYTVPSISAVVATSVGALRRARTLPSCAVSVTTVNCCAKNSCHGYHGCHHCRCDNSGTAQVRSRNYKHDNAATAGVGRIAPSTGLHSAPRPATKLNDMSALPHGPPPAKRLKQARLQFAVPKAQPQPGSQGSSAGHARAADPVAADSRDPDVASAATEPQHIAGQIE